jgi:hypothetical protein
MSVYTITHGFHFDDVSAVQTLTPSEVQPGDSIVIAGAGAKFNGTFTVISVEEWAYIGKNDEGYLEFDYDVPKLNQVLYAVTGQPDDESYAALAGTLTFTETITWTTSALVLSWLGIDVATANDTAFVAKCVSASNYWCFRKRREAGYTDSQSTVPSPDVELGATMYAATLYRERGTSGDSYGGFDGMGNLPMPVTLHRIMQLLGCGRAQVA